MGAFTASVEHGCLLLEDQQPTGGHDSWNPADAQYNAEDDTVIFSVIPSVDGLVSVRVWRGEPEVGDSAPRYFAGTLRISYGRVVLHDPNDHVSMTFYLARGANPFYVLTDSVEFPESVDIVFPDA